MSSFRASSTKPLREPALTIRRGVLRFSAGDLRPEDSKESEEFLIIVKASDSLDEIVIPTKTTFDGYDGMLAGECSLILQSTPIIFQGDFDELVEGS